MHEECVYVVNEYIINQPEDNPIWVAKTFEGAERAVFDFMKENNEDYLDFDHNWDYEWRCFTNQRTYVIIRVPLNE